MDKQNKKIYPFGTTDQHRRDLAFIIGSIACFSTIFHEAGHILNGHLDYMKQTFHEIAQKSILNVVNSYNSIFSTQISPNNLLSQMEQGQTENQLLMMEWNKIYPILNNYKKENIYLPKPFKNI